MSSIRAYRFQIRLRPALVAKLRRTAGGLRWVWNQALAEQQARHARGEKYASYVDMAKWLTAWRNAAKTQWLAEGPIHPQQQVLRRLDEAYRRFFAAAKAGQSGARGRAGPPSFKRRGEDPGIRFPDPKQFALDAANGRLKLPKLGWVRLRMSQPVSGSLRNVSLTREGEHWFASIQVQKAETAPALDVAPTLGIDLGVAAFAATSEEVVVAPLKAMARQQARLRRYQKAVSRKKKGSCNRRKAVQKLSGLHARIARQRGDWLHKLSTQFVSDHPFIAIEDLKVAAMSASAKGTAAKPGNKVRQKAGLNRGILDAAWAEFRRQLEYKAAAVGGEILLVDPAYSSQRCSCCAHVDKNNRKTQSAFICLACGHTGNADINAAKNILAAGHAVWSDRTAACGEAVRRPRRASARGAASAKQEPAEEIGHA